MRVDGRNGLPKRIDPQFNVKYTCAQCCPALFQNRTIRKADRLTDRERSWLGCLKGGRIPYVLLEKWTVLEHQKEAVASAVVPHLAKGEVERKNKPTSVVRP